MMEKNYDRQSYQAVFIQYRNVSDGQTDRRADGRTDRITISISRVSLLTRDKNQTTVTFSNNSKKLLLVIFWYKK